MNDLSHESFMQAALGEARKASAKGEVPVGAVVVQNGRIISRGHNLTESKKSGLLHAEMVALKKASARVKGWRLNDCDLYVTLEPCTMCAGAMALSRIRKVFFGAADPKAGALVSTAKVLENPKLNHRVFVEGGLLASDCGELLSGFFRELRRKSKT